VRIPVKEIYSLYGKTYTGSNYAAAGVSVDTRTLKKGDVFFALKGEKTDGNKFVNMALEKGAVLVVCEKKEGERIITVRNSKKALMKLAEYYHSGFPGLKTAAVTGSSGKTTVKEILARILGERYRVHKNIKSYNNFTGLPLTVFGVNNSTQVLVAEIGMNRKGEITELVKIIKPGAAVITNAGRAHAGFFRSVKDIARAKAEIIDGVKKGGAVILNKDDRFYEYFAETAKGKRIVSFGASGAAYCFRNVRKEGRFMVFELKNKNESVSVRTRLMGIHNACNIAAAAAAASVFGCGLKDVKNAMKNFNMKGLMRFEEKIAGGIRIINDSYNANPDSFRASVEALKWTGYKNIIAVVGDMLELGKESKEAHLEAGRLLASLEPKKVLVCGKYAGYVKRGFLNSSSPEMPEIFRKKSEIKRALKKYAKKGDTVFIKASRANRLEEIIQ